jgi:hypothetical protein
MFPVFKDKILQALFENDGYVKLKLFTPGQIERLRSYYENVRQEHEASLNDHALYSSVETGNPELLIAVDKLLKETIMAQVEATFQNYQTLISNFLIKNTGENTELMPHQDLTFVNEPDQCSFNLWIPLQKTDRNSGQLRVLKGSHKITKVLRVVPEYPRPFLPYLDTIREMFTDIETDIGECIVINHSVFHGSTTNLTGQPRVAIILGMCSAPADIYYHYMADGDNSNIEKYLMKPEDYYYFNPDGRPAKAKQVDTISFEYEPVSEFTFKSWIRTNPHLSLLAKAKLLYFKSFNT